LREANCTERPFQTETSPTAFSLRCHIDTFHYVPGYSPSAKLACSDKVTWTNSPHPRDPSSHRSSINRFMNPPQLTDKRRLKRIAPLSAGKICGILYGIIGLLFAPIFLVMSMMSAALPDEQRTGLMAFGIGAVVMFPILYAVIGFIGGILGAALYNLVAKWVGGIEVEVE
jgi:hypothetical protein